MAVESLNLAYLIDPFWQGENNNGRPLVGGHMEVFIAGTDIKYITYQDWDGTQHPFKIPLGSDGRATILVDPANTYDCYLYDSFGNLACSRLNVRPNIGGDVYGLTQVYHDQTLTGNGTPTSPLGMVSAKLGVQEPLYFVEDDSATIIGLRDSAYSGLPYVENTALEYDGDGNLSAISGAQFHAASADMVLSGWESGSDGRITAYNGTAFSAGKVYSGVKPIVVDNDNDLISVESASLGVEAPLYFVEDSDSATIIGISGLPETEGLMYESGLDYQSGKITGYNGSAFSAGKVYSGISPVYVDNDNDQVGISAKQFSAVAPLQVTEYSDRVELAITGTLGKIYSGIDPVVVDNVNDTISVNSATLGVQAPLYFVEDSESATIIGLADSYISFNDLGFIEV